MTKIRCLVIALAVFIFSFACAATAAAQQARTYVKPSGDNNNLCTHDQPCRTFAGALSKTTAGGEIIALESGEYGAVTIMQAVSIIAPQGVYAAIAPASGDAITITAGSQDVVVLRGLYLVGHGTGPGLDDGIYFNSGAALHVESCVASGFSGNGIRFVPNATAGKLYVKDTIARNNYNSGIFIGGNSPGTAEASIDHCRLEKNSNVGIFTGHNAKVAVRDSVAAGNAGGFWANPSVAAAAPAELNIESCMVVGNISSGITAGSFNPGTALVRVSNTTVINNATGLRVQGAGSAMFSFGNNRVQGNGTNKSGMITVVGLD